MQRTVDFDDIVTVEYTAADGSTVKQSFQMGKDIPDPRRRPFPLYDRTHIWHQAVIGKKVGDSVVVATIAGREMPKARILEARLPEPEEVAVQ
ncbi:MAG TPA: hypothetical protein VF439_03355 [Candidatus Paceibacterota bacterium]